MDSTSNSPHFWKANPFSFQGSLHVKRDVAPTPHLKVHGKGKWWESGNGEWIVIEHLGREAKAKPRPKTTTPKPKDWWVSSPTVPKERTLSLLMIPEPPGNVEKRSRKCHQSPVTVPRGLWTDYVPWDKQGPFNWGDQPWTPRGLKFNTRLMNSTSSIGR